MPGFTYKSYNFVQKDPIIDYIRTIVEECGLTYDRIEQESGVTGATLRAWFYGNTRKPQAATINAVLRCLGYKLAITKIGYPEEIRPTPYHAPPAHDPTPRNIMGRLAAKNKDEKWASIYGRPTRTAAPEPETFKGQGKVVSRSFPILPPIDPKK